jgi:hypothetical protein
MKSSVLLCLATLCFTGCHLTPYFPSDVQFESDPGILRGVWVTNAQGANTQNIRLELQAVYVTLAEYKVAGTLIPDDGTIWSLQGVVKGNETEQYVRTQARLPLTAQMEAALLSPSGVSKKLYCTRVPKGVPEEVPRFTCGIAPNASSPFENSFTIVPSTSN